MEKEQKNYQKEKQLTFKTKLFNLLLGDIEKWKKLPLVFNEISREMRNVKTAIPLISYFLISFAIFISLMYCVYVFQYQAQYCELKEVEEFAFNYHFDKLNIRDYEQNQSAMYYIKRDIMKNPNYAIICKWDLKRWYEENIRRIWK